ncbi:hypothetical protein P691DRAFT_771456 [Macrolepiota fuliginosa MF-IS2]|uniref:L-arabinokinase n=1 Tax=Macrolepiota fuliginosa MF-IS2 TaxID=1400762 RepID=A0A9P6C600_9AGAR|nr:hypothetical protein P691DRAFT_771456 [Macrolepiota fuliginosa MF-IS2]
MDTLTFAYYCSGHGYGHATRVSAFARHLLSLSLPRRLTIHIVSSAPRHVFADSIACGALYRYADIDPVIVQPLAYRVDRQKSVQVLEDFLGKKDAMLDRECRWLIETGVNCVLSDAAFLGCLAAKSAALPSILITNFTFDSVYSYLATSFVDTPSTLPSAPSNTTLSPSPSASSTNSDQLFPDEPIPDSVLQPLVSQLHAGYQHADLLLRLPGHIPIPSFFSQPALPSPQWVNPDLNNFFEHVAHHLLTPLDATSQSALHTPKPFPNSNTTIPRSVRAAPLLVRPPSPTIYTPEGRANFLQKTGLPDFDGMKILVVSFGGQAFKRPPGSRTNSRMQSRNPSKEALTLSTRSSGLSINSDVTNLQSDIKKPQSKRSSKDNRSSHRTFASLDKIALKPINMNMNAGNADVGNAMHLDLEAIDKGLRTHIKSKSSDTTKRAPMCQLNHSTYSDSSDSSQQDSDPEGTPSSAFFSPSSNTTPTSRGGTGSPAKRRHTLPRRRNPSHDLSTPKRLATPSHILIPGAPPASKPPFTLLRTPTLNKGPGPQEKAVEVLLPEMCVIPATPTTPTPRSGAGAGARTSKYGNMHSPSPLSNYFGKDESIDVSDADADASSNDSSLSTQDSCEEDDDNIVGLLPDENWIAVICGVSKEQWNAENEEGGLPEGFYVAPRDVYMPDLIAVGDVVLGKLGYGMTSECVDACTPFVYVSRPLFIEEHGLRMYLDQEGVGIELSRAAYEGGEWARSVEEAYHKGWTLKEQKKRKEFEFWTQLKRMDEEGVDGRDERRLSERERQGREMAKDVVDWVDGVWKVLGRNFGRGEERMGVVGGGREDAILPVGAEAKALTMVA